MPEQTETMRPVRLARALTKAAIGLPICGWSRVSFLPPGIMSVSKGGAFLKVLCGLKTMPDVATNGLFDNPIMTIS